MSISGDRRASEPRLIFPRLAPFYAFVSDLWYPLIRVTVGAILLAHGWPKVMAGVAAFAEGSLRRRGFEPAVPLAYLVIFTETVGAVCIMLGLFTRVFAAAIAIEMAVITFMVQWQFGFAWTNRGYEYPLMWGLIMFAVSLRGGGPWSLDRKLGWEI